MKATSSLVNFERSSLLNRRSTILAIVYFSFTIGTILVSIPCQRINGYPVPTMLFQDADSNYSKWVSLRAFQAFVLSIVMAFASALATLLIQSKPKLALVSELCSMGFLANALMLMIWALLTRTLKSFNMLSILPWGKWGTKRPLVKSYGDYEREKKNALAREWILLLR